MKTVIQWEMTDTFVGESNQPMGKTKMHNITIQQFIDWRNAKEWRASVKTRAQMAAFTGKGQTNRNGKIYVHETDDFSPVVWDSSESRETTGYYADNYQNETIQWCVIKIAPCNRKRGREALYAPVTYGTGYEGVTIHVDNSGGLDDAIRWGDRLAEREAEDAREEHAKDQAEQRISEARERIHEINRTVIPCLRELRSVTLAAPICAVLRAKIMDYLGERDSLFAKIEALTINPWGAVS